DGMTWEQAIELGRKVTRESDGIFYSGLHTSGAQFLGGQLSLALVDPETNKSLINTDGYKRVFDTILQMYAHDQDKTIGFGNRQNLFLVGKLAMFQDWGLGMFAQLTR